MDALHNLLAPLSYHHKAILSKAELRYLFGADRLGKNTWRELFSLVPDGIDVEDIAVFDNGDEILLIDSQFIKSPTDFTS